MKYRVEVRRPDEERWRAVSHHRSLDAALRKAEWFGRPGGKVDARVAHDGPGRPVKPAVERRVNVSLTLHPATLARLDELAEAAEETRSATVERLIRDVG